MTSQLRLLRTSFSKHVIQAKKEFAEASPYQKNAAAGVFIGSAYGIYLNENRIQNVNYHVREHYGDDMPKYPIFLRVVSMTAGILVGGSVGSLLGGMALCVATGLFGAGTIIADEMMKYDKQCEAVYNARKTK